MSSLGSSTKTKTSGTSVQTPTPAPFLASGYENVAKGAEAIRNLDPNSFLTPANTNQTQSWARAAQGTGDPTGAGIAATNGLLGYTPDNVTAGSLATTDLAPYMNPYQRDVIDSTLSDFGHGNAVAVNQLRGSTPTGAFNGSRAGVAEGTLTGDNLRTLASTLASLNSSNYAQAQGAAGTDIGNRLAADTGNAERGVAGANLRLNAANQSANLGLLGAGNTRADTAAQGAAGDAERAIAQQNNPSAAAAQLQQLVASLMNTIPTGAFTGQTGSTTGTQVNSQTPGLLEILGTLSKIASTWVPIPGKG